MKEEENGTVEAAEVPKVWELAEEWQTVISRDFSPPSVSPEASLAEVVSAVQESVANHLSSSSAIKEFLEDLPKGAGTNCPNSPINELVDYVASRRGTIDKSNPLVVADFIRDIMVPVMTFERYEVAKAVNKVIEADDDPEDYGYQEIRDRGLMLVFGGLADAVDIFWDAWFRRVVVPYQSLPKKAQDHYRAVTADILNPYDYTVFDYDPNVIGGIYNRQTWAQAFPEEIGHIVQALAGILAVGDGNPQLRAYLEALIKAYSCEEIGQLETLWADVDVAWVQLPNDSPVLLVHGMENGYEHPYCVSPEFRLEVRTAVAAELIVNIRQATLGLAEQLGLDPISRLVLESKYRRMDVGTFVTACYAGVCANFRYAGQAVPNRQDIMENHGGKIFLDVPSMSAWAPRYRALIEKHCDAETAGVLAPLMTPEIMLRSVAGHELGHPVGRTSETDGKLGEMLHQLEEGKATSIGVLSSVAAYPGSELDMAALIVGRILRFMNETMMGDDTKAPYVRENLASLSIMLDGILTVTPEGIKLDLEMVKNGVWINQVSLFVSNLLAAYQAGDPEGIRKLVPFYANSSDPEVVEVIAWVNRK